jgi:neutral ceramidase
MSTMLRAGAARGIINPPLGAGKIGGRLFGDPIQAIESDLTASAVVLQGADSMAVILAVDLCTVDSHIADRLRARVAETLGIPLSHVLLNESHNHSAPALPGYYPDSYDPDFKTEYLSQLERRLVEAAVEAVALLQPARIGCGWGESQIGVYRRERRDGRDVLGEVPDHPIDPSVGVIRVDDLDGNPISILFRYSAHPVTVGGRSMVASSDYPGPARDVLERNLGGLAVFLQGCGGNINPRVGIGYEIDCRDTKNRVGLELGGEALKIAAGIRTNTRAGARTPLGNVPNILFTPWEPVTGNTCTHFAAAEDTIPLEYIALPPLEKAHAIHARWEHTLEERRSADAQEWEIRVAVKMEQWARRLVEAVEHGHPTFDLKLQILRINDIVIAAMNVETFFETGLEIKARSPLPNTFVLGYTNGSMAYLPRARDYPEGGWKLEASYALPDQLPQFYPYQIIALQPDSEERAIQETTKLIEQVVKGSANASPSPSASYT